MTAFSQETLVAEVVEESTKITIYHTNDVHGYVTEDSENGVIGLARLAALKKTGEANGENVLLLDAGDATQGLPIASLTQGEDIIELMNLAGYDVMALGNHEFDYSQEVLKRNISLADFSVLSANVHTGIGDYITDPMLLDGVEGHTIIEVDGVKLGFFGITTVDTATSTNPEGTAGLVFENEVDAAKREIAALTAKEADVIIAVVHLGDSSAGTVCNSEMFAEALPEGQVDVIIDGHSHTMENEVVNGSLIVQTGSYLGTVGELTVTVDGAGDVRAEETLLDYADFADITPDAIVTQAIDTINAEQTEILNEVIGETNTTLWAGWLGNVAPTRAVETNYGNLAADAFVASGTAMMEKLGDSYPVIGVENGGGIRTAVYNGSITRGDLINTFPFANTLYMKLVTPQQLYAVMENSGSMIVSQEPETGMLTQQQISGSFLQISGFTVVYNTANDGESKVISITLDGQDTPLDRNDTSTQILMVGNNYVMSGGGEFDVLADIEKYGEAGGEVETIQNYIESCLEDGVLTNYAGTEGRIQFRGAGYIPQDYEAKILITQADGITPAANQFVSYQVDGGEWQYSTTDAEGFLKITVADGGHGVRIAENQQEAYVDNYAGLGITADGAIRVWPVLVYSEPIQKPLSISYRTHVQNDGWQDFVTDGTLSGTTSRSLRLEAIEIRLNTMGGSVEYRTHVQNDGWQDYVADGAMSGTTGRNLRLEAIQIRLTGAIAEKYDIYYRTHIQDKGWLGWAVNDGKSGSAGLSKRLEAIEIRLVEKGGEAPGSTENAYLTNKKPANPTICYRTHVQNDGWQDYVTGGVTSGTTGRNLRLEAIEIQVDGDGLSGNVEYRTHVQNDGWQDYVANGAMAGTKGRSLRLEAIQIRLTGELAQKYHVEYRTHVQNEGWQNWVRDDAMSGTTGKNLRLEAIEIRLVKR